MSVRRKCLLALAVQLVALPAYAQSQLQPTTESADSNELAPAQKDMPSRPIVWRTEWPRFGAADWVVTGAAAATAIATAIVPPRSDHLYGGAFFDDGVRDTLRLTSARARYNARDASDVLLSLEATWPFFVDALITTWWLHDSRDAAAQMALVDTQALAIVTAIQGTTNTVASRERPYGRECGTATQPEQTVECEGNVRYRSFFSGHAAFAFMSAGLVCTHHLKHELFGRGADAVACVVAYGGAAATATLRVMADMHYATDVLTGTAVGTLVGIAVPLFHYRSVRGAEESKAAQRLDVSVVPVGAGLGLGGTF